MLTKSTVSEMWMFQLIGRVSLGVCNGIYLLIAGNQYTTKLNEFSFVKCFIRWPECVSTRVDVSANVRVWFLLGVLN